MARLGLLIGLMLLGPALLAAASPQAAPAGHWRTIAHPPLSDRYVATLAWTGSRVVAWGGYHESRSGALEFFADGATYDPVTDHWATIQPSPLSPRTLAAVGWTGTKLLIWGGVGCQSGASCSLAGLSFRNDGAVYDPTADSWRSVSRGPLADAGRSAASACGFLSAGPPVWTGTRLLVWGEARCDASARSIGAAYDPDSDSWSSMSPAPITSRTLAAVVWTGTRMLVWGGLTTSLRGGDIAAADGASYDPATDRWESIPAAPMAARWQPSYAWVQRRLVIWGGESGGNVQNLWGQGGPPHPLPDGAAYDPDARSWQALAPAPLPARSDAVALATDGGQILVWGGVTGEVNDSTMDTIASDGALYDLASRRWQLLPPPPVPQPAEQVVSQAVPVAVAVAAGDRVILLAGPALVASEWTPTVDGTGVAGGLSGWQWVGIVAALVAIAAVSVLLIHARHHRGAPTRQAPAGQAQAAFCGQCGTKVRVDERYCRACGADLA